MPQSKKIKQIGILIADKQFGKFELNIDWVKLYQHILYFLNFKVISLVDIIKKGENMRDPGNGNEQNLNMDDIIDDHVLTSIDTPLRKDAFKLDDELKIELIEKNFREIMNILGLDLNDESNLN